MNFDLDISIPVLTVFIQGILSFLSPCVLPIIPLYMGYLAGGSIDEDSHNYSQKTILINTFFFVVGISFAFLLLGLSFSFIGRFFNSYQDLISRLGGIFIIFLGLLHLGVFSSSLKNKEYKLPVSLDKFSMNPLVAFIMGFVFSFAWTPCVGPALSSVLIMVSSSNTSSYGLLLVGIYTLGFTIPFLILGSFTKKSLNLLKKHRGVMKYSIKIGGLIMVLIGIMMTTGLMTNMSRYLSSFDGILPTTSSKYEEDKTVAGSINENETIKDTEATSEEISNNSEPSKEDTTSNKEVPKFPAIDFQLKDQFGKTHKLSDYKGKVVFLNFWATWCPPCRKEMPDIQKLYESYGSNKKDVIILGITSATPTPDSTSEEEINKVIDFLKKNNYTYPSVIDSTYKMERLYNISAYPTTFMIDIDGNIFGYLPGMMTYEIMESIIEQTKNKKFN